MRNAYVHGNADVYTYANVYADADVIGARFSQYADPRAVTYSRVHTSKSKDQNDSLPPFFILTHTSVNLDQQESGSKRDSDR